jgi:Transposase IS116/IS110/IS902 family
VDAATLAQLLRADLLPEAWIAPQATRDLRALLRHRAALVRLSTSLTNRVHAVLADRGIPDHSSLWTGPGRAWLRRPRAPSHPTGIIQDCCGLLDALATPITRLEREIARLAKPDPRVLALMALPGVGRLTAMTLVAEIGDIARFPTARKLCAWAGLTPQVRNLRPQGPPRPHHQAGLALGARDPAGSRSDGQAPPHVRQRLQRVGPPPRQPHRHYRDRSAAAGPLLPHPYPAGGPAEATGEGQYRARSRFRMSLQHGRPA